MTPDPPPSQPKEHKALNMSVYICETENCPVLLYMETAVNGLECPHCRITGGIAVDGQTRNFGKPNRRPYV